MAGQNKISFLRGKGGLGRPLAGLDHVSGFIDFFANIDLPTGWATAWVTATAFKVGDVVIESTIIYRCLIAHTSGVFATDLAAGKWVVDETATTRTKIVFSIGELEALGVAKGSATTGVLWYHANEYFRIQPKGELWIFLGKTGSIDYLEPVDLQDFAEGRIRNIGFLDIKTAFATANLTTIQGGLTTLEGQDEPLSLLYAADFSAVADLSTLSDLKLLSNKNVSVILGEDGGNDGAALAISETNSITALGAILGLVSLAKVHQNIAHIALFNLVSGKEFDVAAMANGQKVKDLSDSLLDGIADKGYIFIKKFTGLSGTFASDSDTAIAATSDFSFIENNRTIDKAVRNVRTFLLPNLNSPLLLNDDGTLTEETIAIFTNDAARALEQMEVDGEISAFRVTIDPVQDVLATSKIEVGIVIVPVGVAREIEVTIGFTVSIT